MIPTDPYCIQRLKSLLLDIYFRTSTFVSKTVSSTEDKTRKINKQNDLNDKTFTFLQRISSLSLSKNLCHGPLSGGCHPTWWKLPSKNWPQSPPKTSSRLFAWKHSQKFDPKPQHTSNPLQAPPARIFSSSLPPCWLAGWQRVGGPPSLYPLIPSPPPVLHSFHSHPSHLIPSVHQNCSLKVFDVNSFCHLSVQAACV